MKVPTNMKKYIIYEPGEFLYSDDDWKTINYVKKSSPGDGYKEEPNQDKAFLVRLEYRFGKKIKNYIKKELDTIGNVFLSKTGNKISGYGDAFEIFAISVLHDISVEKTIDKYIVIGPNDGGIDAVFYDKNNCLIYQIKVGVLTDNYLKRMEDSIGRYVDETLKDDPLSSDLQKFLEKMDPQITEITNIEYKTISVNGKLDSNIYTYSVFTRFIENKIVCFSRNKRLKITVKDPSFKTAAVASKDKKIYFLFANADRLIEDLKKYFNNNFTLDDICASNVRGSLGKNDDMEYTICNEPTSFCAYNNGISIVGDFKAPRNDAFSINIERANVINGQQTIYNLYYQKEIEKRDISNITVPVFIKRTTNDEEERNIAKYNNSQKAITAVDLLSLDVNLRKVQRDLIQKQIGKGFYLKLVSSGSKQFLKETVKIYGRDQIIKLSDFIKLYSVIKKPSKLGEWKNSYNKEIEATYKNGFDNCDVELAHKICKAICESKPIIKENRSEYSIADLALQYLLFKGNDVFLSKELILENTNKFKGNGRPADVYKKNAFSNLRTTIASNKPKFGKIKL